MTTKLLPQVFRCLLDRIMLEATQILHEEGLLETNRSISLDNKLNQIFGAAGTFRPRENGTKPSKQTIAYAVRLKIVLPDIEGNWRQLFRMPRGIDNRKLQDAYRDYRDWQGMPLTAAEGYSIPFRDNYLALYLAFIGAASKEAFLKEAQLEQAIKDRQLSLWAGADLAAPKPQPHTSEELYYHCHHLDIEKWSETKVKSLAGFNAVFELKDTATKVSFHDTPSGERYAGSVIIKSQGKEALITAFSQDQKFSRPVAIAFYHNCNCPFKDLDICVGFFINITRSASCIHGAIVFEKIQALNEPSRLDSNLLCAFLADQNKAIKNGGYRRLKDFTQVLEKYRPRLEEEAFANRLVGRYFQAIILSKKGRHDSKNEQFNRIEAAYFKFGPGNQLSCRSDYPGGPLEYAGHVEYFPPNKAIFYLHRQPGLPGQYQIVIDLPENKNLQSFSGIYSGITQDNHLAAGRVRFHEIMAADYQASEPGVYELHSEPSQSLLEQYEDLRNFFSGNLDNYLDNNAIFYENPLILEPTAANPLEKLPGTYYYYRTRTIKGHAREVKRYPLLIKPDGNLAVKIKADGEEFTAVGKAIRKHGRVYMHLLKKDKYDGLAILYPNWLRIGQVGQDIKAVYASTSKSGHLMAGRMFLLRLSDDFSGEYFNDLLPDNISIDQAEQREDVREFEIPIIQSLAGQFNNFIAIRHFNEDVLPFLGQRLFESACFLGSQQQDEEALRALLAAIMQGGFADVAQLKQALDGPLASIKERFRQAPASFDITQSQGEDQREYLQDIIDRL